MALDPATIEARLRAALPDADIVIGNPRGDGSYLVLNVSCPAFTGLGRVEQHRMVYKALGEKTIDPPPTLSVKTYIPGAKP